MFRTSNNNNNNTFIYKIIKDAENRILDAENRILDTEKRINRRECRILHIKSLNYKNKKEEKKYCRLINNKDVQKIVGLYYEFSLGKIDELNKILTMDEYNRLTVVLYELSEANLKKNKKCKKKYSDSDSSCDNDSISDSDSSSSSDSDSDSSSDSSIDTCGSKRNEQISCYEKFRINIVRSLEALMKAIQINNDVNTYKKLLESYSDAIKAYNDIKALTDRYNHLKELQKSAMSSFLNVNVIMPLLQLKPEYAEYIKKYGYPEGGIFESDKIAEILKTLGNLGNGDNCDDISLKSTISSIGTSSGNCITSSGSGTSSVTGSGSHSGSGSGIGCDNMINRMDCNKKNETH